MNGYHFRENLNIFEHLLNSDVNSNGCEKVNLFPIVVSFDDDSPILSHPDTSQTEGLREIYHAAVPANPKFGSVLRSDNHNIVIVLGRFGPLTSKDIILLSPFLTLILGQVSVSKNIILELGNQKCLAI